MITITNMKEMPKSCRECPFYFKYHYQNADGYCNMLKRRMECVSYSVRYYDCPLKEVKEPVYTDEEILDAIFCDFCGHIDGGESNLRGVNDIDFVLPDWNHDMNSSIKVSFTDGSSLVYFRNSDEV